MPKSFEDMEEMRKETFQEQHSRDRILVASLLFLVFAVGFMSGFSVHFVWTIHHYPIEGGK